ncbi:hypothetical protein HDU86_000877 [Geranomyces michiganensis]|nr:hypothetical protein HDU86_000877 [Geranomyces michiganensis]
MQAESITARLENDIPLLRRGIGENVGHLIRICSVVVCCLVQALVSSWKLTLVIMAVTPLVMAVGYGIVRLEGQMVRKSTSAFAQATRTAEQAFNGIRTVAALSLQQRFANVYEKQLLKLSQAESRKALASGFTQGGFLALIFLVFSFAFWYAGRMSYNHEIEGPNAVTVVLAMMILASSMMSLPEYLASFAVARSAAKGILAVILSTPAHATLTSPLKPSPPLDGTISFKNVQFMYPARPTIPILSGLTFNVHAGHTVAFVGSSGSGKSTIVSLLQRLYEPAAGRITVNGQDISNIDPASLRKQIGIVGQEPVLLAVTIKQNILLGLPEGQEVSSSEFIRVCKMAQCHDFVSTFEMGYDTLVGPGTLSGGQKQRVAIARALISQPKLLLLDEATSALDTRSERLVQKAIDAASVGRTTIVIAHRLSTIKNANVIHVMQKGAIVESGTHAQLYSLNGKYTQLVDKQRLAAAGFNHPDVVAAEKETSAVTAQASEEEQRMLRTATVHLESAEVIAEQVRERLTREEGLSGNSSGKLSNKRRVWRYMRKGSKKRFCFGTCAACAAGLVFPMFAIFLGFIIFAVMTNDQADFWAAALAGVAVFAFLSKWAQVVAFGGLIARTAQRLRLDVFTNLTGMEMGFFDAKGNAPAVLAHKLGAIEHVPRVVTDMWSAAFEIGAMALLGFGQSFSLSARLARVLLALVPGMVAASVWQSWSASKFAERSKIAFEQAGATAAEAVREVRTLKALQKEDFAVKRYDAFLQAPYELSKRDALVDSLAYGLQSTAAMLTLSVGLGAGQSFINHGADDLPHIISTILCMLTTMLALANAAAAASSSSRANFAASVSAISPNAPGFVPQTFRSGFSFQNLWFQYPTATRPTFRGEFTLEGKENQSLALVGASGCGKSTIIGLLLRWYEASGGESLVGGVRIRDYALSQGLRANIALVGQEPILFDMSIGDNIRWGCEGPVPMDMIIEAATQADIHSFVVSLTDGYDTMVGDKGGFLSGGQKQRIAIARALVRRPKLLLLDEATSALDSTAEAEVQRAIDRASMGRTTVTVAHRLSTIMHCDKIAVVVDGEVVECGGYDELVALDGEFAEMARQQHL